MFTKQHYEKVAEILMLLKPIDTPHNISACNQWKVTVKYFAIDFAKDNPLFNPETFYKACGYPILGSDS